VTRESKLALIIGFVLVLVVGVLVSDHFSQANSMSLDMMAADDAAQAPSIELGVMEKQRLGSAIDSAITEPVVISNGRSFGKESDISPGSSILDQVIDQVQDTEFPEAMELTKPREEQDQQTAPTKAYTVRAGDTLIGIARRQLGNGERWTLIHRLNADVLGPDAILKIGMRLRIPADARTSGKPERSSSRAYTVVSGDILGNISMKLLGTSKRADEIAKLNGLESANDIRIGMILKIPAK
jgi:nucleoid-associated protein YgaU